ncbi:S41 family peptidase [Paenibacillus mendelii]|nr:S41 family peptidase [Paenibacillus mendelii]
MSPVAIYAALTIRFDPDYSYTERHPAWSEPSKEGTHFHGKIMVLANRYVGSAAEDFIMPFKDNGRVIARFPIRGRIIMVSGTPRLRRQ